MSIGWTRRHVWQRRGKKTIDRHLLDLPEIRDFLSKVVVDQTGASWNRVANWLRSVGALRGTALTND